MSEPWTGALLVLAADLQAEARAKPGKRVARLLASGYAVAYRLDPETGRMACRIFREGEAAAMADAWTHDAHEFIRYLGLTGWSSTSRRGARGYAVLFTEPAPVPGDPMMPRRLMAQPQPELNLSADREAQHERALQSTGG